MNTKDRYERLISRRQIVLNAAFSFGGLGLKSLLIGVPPVFLTQRTLAHPGGSKFLIFSESKAGDPLNANAPGTYVAGVRHPKVSEAGEVAQLFEKPTKFSLGGQSVIGAEKWSNLSEGFREHLHFVHFKTNSVSHNEAKSVQSLFGGIKIESSRPEILPSAASVEIFKSLGTLQEKPISLKGDLTFKSIPEAPISPSNLKKLFLESRQGNKIVSYRDQLIDTLYKDLKKNGTPAQKSFLDDYSISRSQARIFSDKLGQYLEGVNGDKSEDQVRAAIALIKLNAAPVIRIGIRFGGDNHKDSTLERECKETIEGVDALQVLWDELKSNGLEDKVLFAKINVFGRSLEFRKNKGRDHNKFHSVGLVFGSNIKGGVSGGLDSRFNNVRCAAFNSNTGLLANPDVTANQSHSSLVKTIYDRLNLSPEFINQTVRKPGKIISHMKV